MAFANNFNGDIESLPIIQSTLERKLYALPGVTCDADLSVSQSGEAFTYYVRGASNVSEGAVGAQVTYKSTGVKRVTVTFETAKKIHEVVPNVNFATVKGTDVIGDKVVQDTITVANGINSDFLTKVGANADAATDATCVWDGTVDTAYAALLALRADFRKKNQAHNVEPTACFVSTDLYSALLAKNVLIFKDGKDFGELLGFTVIEAPELAAKTAYLMNAKAMIAAQNISTLVVTDATQAGFPSGVIIGGEVCYRNEPSELVTHGEAKDDGAQGDTPEKLIVKFHE